MRFLQVAYDGVCIASERRAFEKASKGRLDQGAASGNQPRERDKT